MFNFLFGHRCVTEGCNQRAAPHLSPGRYDGISDVHYLLKLDRDKPYTIYGTEDLRWGRHRIIVYADGYLCISCLVDAGAKQDAWTKHVFGTSLCVYCGDRPLGLLPLKYGKEPSSNAWLCTPCGLEYWDMYWRVGRSMRGKPTMFELAVAYAQDNLEKEGLPNKKGCCDGQSERRKSLVAALERAKAKLKEHNERRVK